MKKGWGMVSFILFCIGLVLSVIGGVILPANAHHIDGASSLRPNNRDYPCCLCQRS